MYGGFFRGTSLRDRPLSIAKLSLYPNLLRAITDILARYPDRYLWADGVCINQADLQERTQQVCLMGSIYSVADFTIVHPGHFPSRFVKLAGMEGFGAAQYNADLPLPSRREAAKFILESLKNPLSVDELILTNGIVSHDPHEKKAQGATPKPRNTAMSILNVLNSRWSSDQINAQLHSLQDDSLWEALGLSGTDDESLGHWDILYQFFFNDWFRRSWVIQEAVLPKKIFLMYAGAVLPFEALIRFWLLSFDNDLPDNLQHGKSGCHFERFRECTNLGAIITLRTDRAGSKASESPSSTDEPAVIVSLLDTLILTRSSEATDARDKVYSLLGMVNDQVATTIQPDYSLENTATAVYVDVAQKYMRGGQGIQILAQAGTSQSPAMKDLPSWVPDWSSQFRSTLHSHAFTHRIGGHESSILLFGRSLAVRGCVIDSLLFHRVVYGWEYSLTDDETTNVIQARTPDEGHAVDQSLLPESSMTNNHCLAWIWFSAYTSLLRQADLTGKSIHDVEEMIARTLVADCDPLHSTRISNPAELMTSYAAFCALNKLKSKKYKLPLSMLEGHPFFRWPLNPPDGASESALRRRAQYFRTAMRLTQRGRAFTMTANGRPAVVPCDIRKGDLVAFLEPFTMPFVVRPKGDCYELVGDCYVHGIMDGELTTEVGDGALDDEYVYKGVDGKTYAVKLADSPETYGVFKGLELV